MRWFWLSMILACGSRPAPTPPPPVTPTPSPQATPVPTQPAPVEVPLPVGAAATTPGPLSTSVRSTETPWDDRKKAMRRNEAQLLSSQEITDDTAELSRIVHLFFVPRTVEDKTGIDLLNRLTTLSRLAPYSVSSTFNAYLPNRIDYCVRPPDEQWPCDPDVATRAPSNLPPFEIAVDPSGVGRVILRDLSDAANPAWATFDSELAKVAAAPALLIDMRAAWGDDPRPLLAWLSKLAGRSQLVPLREIHRPAALDPFVAEIGRAHV